MSSYRREVTVIGFRDINKSERIRLMNGSGLNCSSGRWLLNKEVYMPAIPGKVNGVVVEFSSNVNRSVDEKIINALKHILHTDISSGHKLNRVFISSANDQHKFPSRHVQGNGKAVDISRINGMKMSVFYPSNPSVKAITDAIQSKFETFPKKRENFGPFFQKKLGQPYSVGGHKDHIHISVN
ncbi:hypothetical protein [Marinobacter oulmenensis]|uniref:Peptidase M15A C-terminal domain-containing protein n=1 Tax=Marinobacter oulmenensis TaxID=643747 RepID=A0A840UE24_9GAMM|nr:hypothetical protein [Marinobacter oulmenensis]MBB5321630.1 hypothetical protein [Marinobacter oulmenensis]